MHKFIMKRLFLLIPIMIGVVFIVFSIMSLMPGDPGTTILGPNAPQSSIDQLNHELGYDKPFVVRFINYASNALHGDFGNSWKNGRPDRLKRLYKVAKGGATTIYCGFLYPMPCDLTPPERTHRYSKKQNDPTMP